MKMKHLAPDCDVKLVISQYLCSNNEIAVIDKGTSKEYEELAKMLNDHKVEFSLVPLEGYDYTFDCLNDVKLPALILGQKYIIPFDEVKPLLDAQPEQNTLFFKGIEYNMLWRGQQMINHALSIAAAKAANLDMPENAELANLLYLPEDKQVKTLKADLPY
jgi:hypothetical protein